MKITDHTASGVSYENRQNANESGKTSQKKPMQTENSAAKANGDTQDYATNLEISEAISKATNKIDMYG